MSKFNERRSKGNKFAKIFFVLVFIFSLIQNIYPANADGNGLQWYWRTDSGVTTGNTFGTGQLVEFGANHPNLCHSQTGGAISWTWSTNSPGGSCPINGFTTFGSGYLRATWTGTYYFCDQADDGFWLRIDSNDVINNWAEQGAATGQSCNGSVGVNLNKGQTYSIKVFHHENAGGADMRLLWKYDQMSTYEIIDQKFLSTSNSFDASINISSFLPDYAYGNNTYSFGRNISSNNCGANQTSTCQYTISENSSLSPLTYSLVGSLPNILQVNSSNGSIAYNSGGTFTPGTYSNLKIRATDAYGSTYDSNAFSIALVARSLTVKASNQIATYTGASVSTTNSYSITSGSLYGSDTFTSLTFTYTASSPSYNSSTAPTNAGTYTITPSAPIFTIGSAAGYSINFETGILTINKSTQSTLSLNSITGTYLNNLKLTTTGGSDAGVVSFSVASTGTANCSISNSDSLTSTAAGSCQVLATKASTSNYFAAYDTRTITLGKASLQLTISVSGSSTIKYGSTTSSSFTTDRNLGTGNIASRSGTISYSSTGASCSINSSTGSVSMLRASGTCAVQVSLAGDTNYSDTTSTALTLTAAKADAPTVSASAVNLIYNGNSQTIPYSYSISGLKFSDTLTALSYSYSGTPNSGGGASGSANVDQAGVYTITPSSANISNSDSYTAVNYVTGVLTVDRAVRSITGSAGTSAKYGSTTTVTASTSPLSDSDGSVSFTSGASTACSVSSGTGVATMTKATGTCSITPSISQGYNYSAATGSAVSITPATADALVVTAGNSSTTYSGSTVSVTPTYSVSGLKNSDTVTVTYKYSGLDNSGASYGLSSTPPANAGTFSIIPVLSISNSDSYTAPASLVNGTLTINRATRTLSATTFNTNSLKYGGTATVTSNSTSPSTNSDGVFSYSIGSDCSINASTGQVTAISSSGTCSETTTIGRGNNYETATASSVTFTLSKADTITVTSSTPSAVTYTGSPAVSNPTVSVTGLVNGDAATGATYNYSRTATCATGGTCSVGDTGPGGGTIFYASGSAIDAADGISTGGIYLEAAPATFSKTTYNWCEGITDPYTTTIGGTASSIGTGAINTKLVASRCIGGAVYEAANLTLGGKSDWFLPSGDELAEMYSNRTILGFGTGAPAASYLYWGSTESANWIASSLVPWAGIGGQNKGQATPYWPIRAFSPTASAYASSTTAPTNAGIYVITPSALTLSGGSATDNYVSTIYETSTLTINKADQSIFSNYNSLEAILGTAFQIYPFGGSGDGAVYLSVSNGTATGCSASLIAITAATSGTCVLTVTKSANENYNSAQSSFTITFIYFVPAAAPPVSTHSTQIAISAPVAWSSTATSAPSISSLSVTSGAVGTTVTITGVGLDGVDIVKIGRKNMNSVTGIDSTHVSAVIPAGAISGPIYISNSFGSDFSSQAFTVTP